VYEAALAIHREIGDRVGVCVTLGNLGKLSRDEGRADEAHLHYATALQIAREMGNRREEGIALGGLAGVHRDRGEADEARARYEEALAIHREVGNRRFEGEVLANLAELLAKEGGLAPAREALRMGEELLREIDDPLDLAKLLCIRGCVEVGAGAFGAALAALEEAQSLASALAADPESELCREIVKLRLALERSRDSKPNAS
jgi:tetratricopeptide (TPR) repeat protein